MSVESLSIGNPFLPMISHRQFEDAVRHIGTNKLIHKEVTNITCTDCYDAILKQSDPNCPNCKGLGHEIITNVAIQGIIRHRPPHGMYGAGHILTIGGEAERADMMLFTHHRYKKRIDMGDFILYDGYEYRVINKVFRRGSKNRIVYISFELFKTTRTVT